MIHRARLVGSFVAAAIPLSCNDPHPPAPAPSASAPVPTASASAPAPKPPAPIDATLPAAAPGALERRAECGKKACTLTHVVPDEVRPVLSDGAPAVIWEQVINERSSVVFPRDEVVEVMGVVLDGTVDITAMEMAPKATSVGGRWAGFRAPGGGVTINGAGGKAARVALVVATGKSLSAHLDQRDRPGAPPSWNWKTRPRRVMTFSFADRPDLAWGGGAYHARTGWDEDDKAAAVIDLIRFSANAGVAEHTHDREWEILALIEGEGALVRRPASGEQRVEAKAGTILNIPAGVRHTWEPSGKAPLFAIQVYAPPGPEQRFKKLAAPAQ
ncbi:MAG: cupin domain-containing protein [Minicystis sp.]